ncbi:MAG: carbonic anhydrase [Candidatus Korobacteraceae bacterium]
MRKILDGVLRFQKEVFPSQRDHFKKLASFQSPETLFITCSDSRVVPNLITQTEPGELFLIRNAGNIVPPYGETQGGVSATIEYAVIALGVKHIIVCGHTDCGAMKGILHPEKLKEMPTVAAWLHHGDAARQVVQTAYPELQGDDRLPAITRENVVAQLRNLTTHPCVAARQARGDLDLHAWVYNIGSGEVLMYDGDSRAFAPLGTMQSAVAD